MAQVKLLRSPVGAGVLVDNVQGRAVLVLLLVAGGPAQAAAASTVVAVISRILALERMPCLTRVSAG
jgi:hypothetical protein